MIKADGIVAYKFQRNPNIYWHQKSQNILELNQEFIPSVDSSIISSDITVLSNIKKLRVDIGSMIHGITVGDSSFLDKESVEGGLSIVVNINGKTFKSEQYNNQNRVLLNQNVIEIPIGEFLDYVSKEYLKDLGVQ